MKTFRRILAIVIPVFVIGILVTVAYHWNYIPHRRFTSSEKNVPTIHVMSDADDDEKDDLPDILDSARSYTESKKPSYEEEFYAGGWPNGNKGMAVDVVNYGLLGAGYNMRDLIWKDYKLNPHAYKKANMESKDKAFRIADNLKTYMDRHFTKLTTDKYEIKEWQGGDIVTFKSGHIAVVSDVRNGNGVAWLVHHYMRMQGGYEQDVFEYDDWGPVTGHYRIRKDADKIIKEKR